MNSKSEEIEIVVNKLKGFGLLEKQAVDTARNKNLANQFLKFIDEIQLDQDQINPQVDKSKFNLLLRWTTGVITKLKDKSTERKNFGAKEIFNGNLNTPIQVDAALEYLSSGEGPVDEELFKKNCGVGISMTKDEVKTIVKNFVQTSRIAQESKWSSLGKTTGELKKLESLRWCNPIDLKTSVDETFLELFGSKSQTPQLSSKQSSTTTKAKKPLDTPTTKDVAQEPSIFEVGMLSQLHKPGQNPQKDPMLVEEHLKATGGKVITRFPPEPNGFLHIGHSKAIAINFGFAAYHNGKCNLRYDDTNPEAEDQVYFDSILDIVRWLGFEPAQITYSSDHFQKLYELAEELICRDKAYVCFCSGSEIKANRGGEERGPRKACAHRSLPITTSLEEFRKMKDGHYKPNEIILRMKQDLEDGNPQMWDLVAYRVLEASHHRTGDHWKIYPTYDFTHCLVDSFENITHSLCTTEFIQSRVSYEWLCHALDVYTPRQTEYGRLNLEGTVMSKRKIMRLVNEGHVEGWDDPRLYTLIALRRRGVPPEAILKFVNSLGVSTSVSNIATHRFEQTVRQHLELTTPRLMMVLKPLKVIIENLADNYVEMIDRAVHPKVPEMGSVQVPFTKVIYIEREDFNLNGSDDFFRLTPTRSVGLFQVPYPIRCKSWSKDPLSGEVTELLCTYENEQLITKTNKPKAYIHWIAHSEQHKSPVRIDETRIYKTLFKSPNPAALNDFLKDVDRDSLEIVKGALIEIGFWNICQRSLREATRRRNKLRSKSDVGLKAKAAGVTDLSEETTGLENIRFQGMRTAYFTVDRTSNLDQKALLAGQIGPPNNAANAKEKLVLNWIVSLKEDSGKKFNT
ncbi:hypothetical protein O181_019942 [Austropuccinia psidii MF-1]|uniref:glutamine--tRNA ligase n=1 Tax=Austropuccinia psidii MF-1 TaxID=1389203 RepID=A0A9Q3CCJ3_9BASI|nr:hypothetical protein [Austropuccinia psidii MF-1]